MRYALIHAHLLLRPVSISRHCETVTTAVSSSLAIGSGKIAFTPRKRDSWTKPATVLLINVWKSRCPRLRFGSSNCTQLEPQVICVSLQLLIASMKSPPRNTIRFRLKVGSTVLQNSIVEWLLPSPSPPSIVAMTVLRFLCLLSQYPVNQWDFGRSVLSARPGIPYCQILLAPSPSRKSLARLRTRLSPFVALT